MSVFSHDIITNGEQVISLSSVKRLREWARFNGIDVEKCMHVDSRYPHIDLPDEMRHRPLNRAASVSKLELVLILIAEGLATESRQFGCEICLSDQSKRRWLV